MLRFLPLILLVACTGPRYAELQDRPPAVSWVTAKTPAQYAGCLAPKLVDLYNTTRVIPDGDAQVVAVTFATGYSGIVFTVTAHPDGRVEVREMSRPASYTKERALAQSCL